MSSAHLLSWTPVPGGKAPPVSVKQSANSARITGFTLINADTDKAIGTIKDGVVLNLAKLPKNLNIAANVSGGKNGQSVNFVYDNNSRTENGAPFALGSDTNGDFWGWSTTVGTHALTATPWSGRGATGSAGRSLTVKFTVVSNSTQPAISTSKNTSNTGKTSNNGKGNTGSTPAKNNGGSTKTPDKSTDSNKNNTGGKKNDTGNKNDTGKKNDTGSTPQSTGGGTKHTGGNTGNARGNSSDSGNSTGDTSTGGTTTDNQAPPPVVQNDQGGPVAVIDAISTSVPAGTAIHVEALKSTLNAGDVLSARFDWDFGDSGSKYNQLTGFNAAHLYDKPGTYTVTLTVTNSAGKVGTAQSKVTITADDRQVIYVSPSGNDSNSGTSASSAVKTFARASTLVGDNTEILFQRGSTYNTGNTTMSLGYENIVLGAYGSGSAPVLKYTGNQRLATILTTSGGKNVTIRDVTFDSSIQSIYDQDMNDCIHAGGENISVLNCTVVNAGYFINTNGHPTGFLAQDNSTTSARSLRAYFAWVQGSDQVYLGNTCHDSTWQHCLRNGGTDRLLIAYNDFSNAPNPGGVIKGTLTLHQGNYIYVTGNKLTDGAVNVGPLYHGSGLDNKGARINYIVIENNQIDDATLNLSHGSNHVMIRDNVIAQDGRPAIDMTGWSDLYNRGTSDVYIENNTAINKGTSGKFLLLENDASGITMTHNLYIAPNLAVQAGNGALEIMSGNLNSFRLISDNVWPAPSDGYNVHEGFLYVSANGVNDHAGYKSPEEWEAYSQVENDQFKDVILPRSSYQISLGGTTAGADFKMAA